MSMYKDMYKYMCMYLIKSLNFLQETMEASDKVTKFFTRTNGNINKFQHNSDLTQCVLVLSKYFV